MEAPCDLLSTPQIRVYPIDLFLYFSDARILVMSGSNGQDPITWMLNDVDLSQKQNCPISTVGPWSIPKSHPRARSSVLNFSNSDFSIRCPGTCMRLKAYFAGRTIGVYVCVWFWIQHSIPGCYGMVTWESSCAWRSSEPMRKSSALNSIPRIQCTHTHISY